MKKFIPLVTALTLAAILAGCGGSATQTPPELESATQSVPTPTEELSLPTEAPAETTASAGTDAPPTEAAAASTVSFSGNVFPIFEAKCNKCHGVERVKEGLDMTTYDNLMAGSFNGPVVVPGNADESLLVELIVRGKMPNRGTKATDEELQIIRDWVNQGALNN
jgi:cytochrome c5